MHGRETIMDAPCGSHDWNKSRAKLQGKFQKLHWTCINGWLRGQDGCCEGVRGLN